MSLTWWFGVSLVLVGLVMMQHGAQEKAPGKTE